MDFIRRSPPLALAPAEEKNFGRKLASVCPDFTEWQETASNGSQGEPKGPANRGRMTQPHILAGEEVADSRLRNAGQGRQFRLRQSAGEDRGADLLGKVGSGCG